MIDLKIEKDIIWLYTVEKWSANKIAKKININSSTVISILKKHNIRIRTHKESLKLNRQNWNTKFIDLPIDEIIDLYTAKKIKIQDIADKYFVSNGTIINRLHNCGITLRKNKGPEPMLKDSDINYIIDLHYEKKKDFEDIAEILGCHRATLSRFCKKNGIINKKFFELPHDEIIRLYTEENMTTAEISRVFSVSGPTILKILHKNNIKIRKKRIIKNENN